MTQMPPGGTGEMFRLIEALPRQLEESLALEGLDEITRPAAGFDRVLLCGMGGSAIAGDLVQPLLQHQPISLQVWRDYGLPHWVGPRTLIIAASYSGNTEESLSALAEAGRRHCPVIGITSGGKLAAAAGNNRSDGGDGFPAVILPGGLPPRASLGYGLGALVQVLGRLGLVRDAEQEIAAAAEELARLNAARLAPVGGHSPAQVDPAGMISARSLAEELQGRIPVIYTADGEAHGVGVRWKGQLNENSKCPACLGAFPELNHNDLVGWELKDGFANKFVLLILGAPPDNARMAARVEVTREILTEEFPVMHSILPTGDRALARILSMVQYGDYLSCHLAQLKNVDPVPVDRIGRLKDHLENIQSD